MMKKSTFGAALAFLAAAAGVLTAVALYLRRREQELDEYEKLLFLINRADEATVSAFHEISRIEEEKDGNDSF